VAYVALLHRFLAHPRPAKLGLGDCREDSDPSTPPAMTTLRSWCSTPAKSRRIR
jgi:hypothetical protein